MANNGSRVKSRKLPDQGRVAGRQTRVVSTDGHNPHFCLCNLSAGYRVSNCQQADRAAFASWLDIRSQMTWLDLTLAPREGLGREKIPRGSIRPAIPTKITPDVEHFLSFRFGDDARVIGYRTDEVFHIVWLDPNHDVY